MRVPSSPTESTSAKSSSPNTNFAPGFARLPGFRITSHSSAVILRSSKNSIAPPVSVFFPKSRAGMTFVSFKTSKSSGRSRSTMS